MLQYAYSIGAIVIKKATIRLLGSSLQIQRVFLDCFNKKQTKHKYDNYIQCSSYFFVAIIKFVNNYQQL